LRVVRTLHQSGENAPSLLAVRLFSLARLPERRAVKGRFQTGVLGPVMPAGRHLFHCAQLYCGLKEHSWADVIVRRRLICDRTVIFSVKNNEMIKNLRKKRGVKIFSNQFNPITSTFFLKLLRGG
jgi:hypothetical protein